MVRSVKVEMEVQDIMQQAAAAAAAATTVAAVELLPKITDQVGLQVAAAVHLTLWA